VARARGISKPRIESVVDEFVVGRDFGLLGAPTVNVLELNLALDRQFGRPAGGK
jgi:K+-transporting ATPase ATPase C chain